MNEKEFISRWVEKLSKSALKNYPEDFLGENKVSKLKLPGTSLTLGEELFGNIEIVDTRGNSVLMVNSMSKAKHILYGNKNKPAFISIPEDEKQVVETVKSYEKYLDGILKEIEADFKKNFPETKSFPNVSSEIFNLLNLKRY